MKFLLISMIIYLLFGIYMGYRYIWTKKYLVRYQDYDLSCLYQEKKQDQKKFRLIYCLDHRNKKLLKNKDIPRGVDSELNKKKLLNLYLDNVNKGL